MQKINVKTEAPIRINKYLADTGIYSRRKADALVLENKVHVNGSLISVGTKVKDGDVITINIKQEANIYALYYKPRGEVTGPIDAIPNTLPVGRLDKDSEGLLLYTNDFRVFDNLLNPKFAREKEYDVKVREKATPRVVTILKRGITTQEGNFAEVKDVVVKADGHNIKIVLTEGKKHEIRRMLNALNLTIMKLVRVRIMHMKLNGIKAGEVRILDEKDTTKLLTALNLN